MVDKYIEDSNNNGAVKIADDVIERIALVAANNVDGVVSHIKDLRSGMADILGMKSVSKNQRVHVGEGEVVLDLYIQVEYGKNIVNICNKVQDKVKEAVEMMTDLEVVEVNVHVSGICTTAVKKDVQ